MKLISVNIGRLKTMTYQGRTITTGIFKSPVSLRVRTLGNNLEGDAQADPRVHGGPEKAVYAYPSEHYPFWEQRLWIKLAWGAFGENMTTEGLVEEEVCIGDRYQVGSVILKVSQPRQPCYKLALRLDRKHMIELFRSSGRSGFYFSVDREGELGPNDPIQRVSKSPNGVTIADVNRLHREPANSELLERVLAVPDLSLSQRKHFEQRQTKPSVVELPDSPPNPASNRAENQKPS